MRSSLRFAAVAAALVSAMSCTEAPNEPGSSAMFGRIGIAPSYSAAATAAYNALAAFAIEVTSVHVRLVAPDGSVRDTTVNFPVGVEQLTIEIPVPLRTAGQNFFATLELRAADGSVLFAGTQTIAATSSLTPGTGAVVPIPISYTGPGAGTETVSVSPATGSSTGASTFTVTATGKTAAGATVGNMLARWTTSDATLASVTATSSTTATVTTTGKRGTVVITAIAPTEKSGAASFAIVPPPSRVVVISGNGQSAPAGTAAAQPLVVEVQAADNQPVPGAAVTFRAVTAGASVGVTTPIIADATGRASTTLALGPTTGSYQFEATSGALTAATATATATQAPAASIVVGGGDYQSALVGGSIPQPLSAKVLNRFGGVVSGVTVQWNRVSGGGTLGAASSVTGADGIATVTYRVGTSVGVENIRASLSGIPAPAGEAIFTAVVNAGGPANISGSGGGQRGVVGSRLPNPLIISVTDAFGNPAAGMQVKWSVTAGTASLTNIGTVTTGDGSAQTTVTLGSTPGAISITATVGAVSFTFNVTADAPTVTANPGILTGYVYNAVNNTPLAGVTVSIVAASSSSNAVETVRTSRISRSIQLCNLCAVTVTTGADGRFATAQLTGGDYDVSVTLTGFTSTVILAQRIDGNTVAEAVPLVPASSSPGSISGTVRNASTSAALTSATTVELRAGLNATTGTIIQSVSTNGSGQYVFSGITAGTYTVRATSAGFAAAFKTGISVGAQTTGGQDIFMSANGAAGNVRIVLTWLSTPRDLDSYLTVPGASTVYYGNRGNCSGAPFACLDVDVTSGFGPETVTISQPTTGTYRYSVNQYSGDGSLGTSGARVALYINNVLSRSFSVPAGNGRNWTVFELNGVNVTTINTLDGNNSSESIPSASRIRTRTIRSDAAQIEALKRSNPKP